MLNSQQQNAKSLLGYGVFLFGFLTLLDLTAKHFAQNVFKNYLFAFSIPLPIFLIYTIYLVIICAMLYYVIRNFKNLTLLAKFSWVLIFAGAFSNIVERIFFGYVRDFIYITFFKWTGVYNFADGYIIVGVIFLLFNSTKVIDKHDKI